MSYGVNDMRDGVNLSRMQVTRPLVLHTEVTNLPNLSGYLRFGRNLPVVRFEDSFNTVPTTCNAYEERFTPPVRLAPPGLPPAGTQPMKRARVGRRKAPDAAELPRLDPPQGAPDAPLPGTPAVPPADTGADSTGIIPRPPELTLFGKPAGFRLQQHARRDGARDVARPA